jgi:hypothetical protein
MFPYILWHHGCVYSSSFSAKRRLVRPTAGFPSFGHFTAELWIGFFVTHDIQHVPKRGYALVRYLDFPRPLIQRALFSSAGFGRSFLGEAYLFLF